MHHFSSKLDTLKSFMVARRGLLGSFLALLATLFVFGSLMGPQAHAQTNQQGTTMTKPQVTLETNQGTIVLELDAEKAPQTVENFVGYVNDGFYDGTVFHRVIDNFMIQGVALSLGLSKSKPRPPSK